MAADYFAAGKFAEKSIVRMKVGFPLKAIVALTCDYSVLTHPFISFHISIPRLAFFSTRACFLNLSYTKPVLLILNRLATFFEAGFRLGWWVSIWGYL
jgi:hypothetical protein